MPTIEEFFEKLPSKFKQVADEEMDATIQFQISGEGGGDWAISLGDKEIGIVKEIVDDPDITILVSAEMWDGIINGRENPKRAFMLGRLKVRGNIQLAFRLPQLFMEI
ncbi:SCP2 sterol-binding domain-containing protein [Candidatus Hydrogenedentota bacterium]